MKVVGRCKTAGYLPMKLMVATIVIVLECCKLERHCSTAPSRHYSNIASCYRWGTRGCNYDHDMKHVKMTGRMNLFGGQNKQQTKVTV